MLKTILSVSGKPGLYKMISQGKNLMIIESLIEKKRIPAYAKDKAISLGDISVYTNGADMPLYKVLNNIKAKEEGRAITLDLSKATPDDLRSYLETVLPDFDRERVYPTDIKRLLSWYNILLSVGITDYSPLKEKEEEKIEPEEVEPKEEAKAPAKVSKKAVPIKNTATPKNNVTTKQPAGKTTQRTRQK
jgi:hypothetical protein